MNLIRVAPSLGCTIKLKVRLIFFRLSCILGQELYKVQGGQVEQFFLLPPLEIQSTELVRFFRMSDYQYSIFGIAIVAALGTCATLLVTRPSQDKLA